MRLAIIAAGGLGRVVADIIARCPEHATVGFCDDNLPAGECVAGLAVLGSLDELPRLKAEHGIEGAVVAVGNGAVRVKLAQRVIDAGVPLATVIDPTAIVSPSADLGEAVVIGPAALIGPDARLGRLVVIAAGAVVEHDAELEPACYIGPRSLIDARATVAAELYCDGGTVVEKDQRLD